MVSGLMEEKTMKAMGAVHLTEGGQRLIAVAENETDADAVKIIDKKAFLPQ